MKKLHLLGLITALLFVGSCSSDIPEDTSVGSIAGSVSDRTTGEPVSTATITLTPGGNSAVTGSDGSFSYPNLSPGDYTLRVSKEGYNAGAYATTVKGGPVTPVHITIERIPASIKADKTLLDFGETIQQLSFTIVNTGYTNLEYKVSVGSCQWLSVEPDADVLGYGKTATIIVKVDREKLPKGANEANIVVSSTSGDGNIEITVKAVNNAEAAVNTLDVTNIENTTATLNGEVINPGIPSYTERGFVYDTQANPSVTACIKKLSSPVNTEKTFSCNINELTPTQTYYVRAYMVQNGKTVYGNTISFITSHQPTSVSTAAVTNIDATSATFNGSILKAGNPAFTEKGFCYSRNNSTPTISDNRSGVSGNATGNYSLTVTNLEYPVTYYVRAYAIQSGTAIYGNTVSFTTQHQLTSVLTSSVTNVKANYATFNGKILNVGYPAYTERGFCYSSSSSSPTISDVRRKVDGTSAGDYSITVDNLSFPANYHVRAYAMQSGTPVYGDVITFNTSITETKVVTSAASEITSSTAVLNGSVTEIGYPSYTERGFCYSDSYNKTPTISDIKVVVSGSGVSGNYYAQLRNLEKNTNYSYRAYVMQNGTPVYGDKQTFSTTFTRAEVSTMDASNVGYTTATLNGSVDNIGDPTITERGFCYKVYDYYTSPNISDKRIKVNGIIGGTYKVDITGLEEEEKYEYRAYVIQDGQPIYGDRKTFVTGYAPQVKTGPAYNVKEKSLYNWQASFQGAFSEGNPAVQDYGFVYSTTMNPTVTTGTVVKPTSLRDNGNGVYVFTRTDITGFSPYQTYYYRAYVKNAYGYVYGDSESFNTY